VALGPQLIAAWATDVSGAAHAAITWRLSSASWRRRQAGLSIYGGPFTASWPDGDLLALRYCQAPDGL